MKATKTEASAKPFARNTLIAGFLLLAAHAATLLTLGTHPPGPLLSDLMQLALGAICVFAAYQASRRSGRIGRYFWGFAAATFSLFVVAQALGTYDDTFHAPQVIQWVENLIFFFWFTPFGVALFLDPDFEPRGFDWLLILDLVQVFLFWLAGYFYFFYIPAQATSGIQLTHAVWAPYFIYNGFLLAVFSLRAVFTDSSVVRALFGRLVVFLFVASVADFIFYYGPAKDLQTGDWYDFVWISTNFMFLVGATTWSQSEPQRPVVATRMQPHRSFVIQLLPLLYSLLVLLISLQIAVQRLKLAAGIVLLSFVCSGVSLLVTQVRKERSHRLLGVVIEGTPDAIFVKDREGRHLMINSAGANLLGREVEEVIGKTDVELFPAEIGRLIMERDRQVLQSGRNQTSEEAESVAGETRTYLVTKGPYSDARGKVAGLFGISHDITERKNMEEDLRVQKVFLEQLIETAPEAIAILDPDYTVRKINLEFTRVFGYTSEEACGCDLGALVVPPDKAEETRGLENFSDKAKTSVLETTRRRKDGTRIEVSLLVSPVIVGTDLKAVYCIYRDITERKLADLAIENWKRRYDDAVLASRQVVFDWDSVSGQVTFGGALEEVLGYSPGVFAGAKEKWRKLIHPDDLERYVQAIMRAMETKEAYELEYRVRSSKGEYLMMHEQGRVMLGEGGNVMRIVGFITDVSERRMLEEQLRQSQKMEAVGRLAGGVAHDFNNLLTVITGYSELLLNSAGPEGNSWRKNAEQIRTAANRAAEVTRQLLAFSRQQVLAPQIIDLNTVILNLDSMLRRLIGENIEVLTLRAPDLGTVKADPGQIEQAIMNLTLNARDAMPNGGKLTLETSNVQLDDAYAREHQSVEPGRYVLLAVSDTGVGMSPETQAHIFEPFYTTKELGKGTGLGLSTVYGIVKQSGGYIWVYSEPGRGSTFKVYFPRMDQPVEKLGSEKGSSQVQRGTETILLVEDDSQVRQLTSAILAHCGYKVLAAGGADEALAVCKANHREVELLVTDVVMPGMNGRQLAEQVARISPQVKVLYISGYTSNAIVHHGVLDSGLWFLAKPFSLPALVAKVREVLDASLDSLQGSKSE